MPGPRSRGCGAHLGTYEQVQRLPTGPEVFCSHQAVPGRGLWLFFDGRLRKGVGAVHAVLAKVAALRGV